MKIEEVLLRPIPDMTHARATKTGYRKYPLANKSSRNRELLVDIADYGIAGQSYYSRSNTASDQPLGAVSDTVLLRETVAIRLADINYALQRSEQVAALFGGRVELYVEEGLRSVQTQTKLYEQIFPQLIRLQYPNWTSEQVAERRDQLIAKPSTADSPSPHATGAAVDITLRFAEASPGFVKGAKVSFGRKHADISEVTYPDYFEHKSTLSITDVLAQKNRRIFYWLMRGALLDDDSGFEVNPTEFWHWSYGDQLWATLRGAPLAFFGLPPQLPKERF